MYVLFHQVANGIRLSLQRLLVINSMNVGRLKKIPCDTLKEIFACRINSIGGVYEVLNSLADLGWLLIKVKRI